MSTLQTNFNALLAKLDLDAGVTDEDYSSSYSLDLDSTLELPGDIMLPMIDMDDKEYKIALSNALKEYTIKIRQTLTEIESKLP